MIRISPIHARIIIDYLDSRGGVIAWDSLDLSDPGVDRWMTPADEGRSQRPSWKAGNPHLITDDSAFEVVTEREAARFGVAVRPRSSGLGLKVSDGGSRRIRHYEYKHDGRHVFDYATQEAVILVADSVVPLAEYREQIDS